MRGDALTYVRPQRTFRIKLPAFYPVMFTVNWAHWMRNGTQHGPQSNPRLMRVVPIHLLPGNPNVSAGRVWFYFRGGYAFYIDAYVDRRSL